ncbi:CDP-glycerol glycerophosphotransferase family protein [Paenibacillus silvae]|uniref:CDP-glycerol glycerophosphotransferase family protein n=1 Tax=Paenibacillus silvae TaxID=1325358 RepID=UPI002005E88A|nr:CDP-glycerol glycerophosphotransferase family protein [Paenibacillus silvae]MCK6075672.1 CDP-glycerol glycerophosphotransferase family protein [Paenibacillus silvae]MCK6150060.1 CDP-glycerol glycerophosphotransferase family protein [Paenibacillus silvae]MCK6268358.1 CDP-glycerol glycerophosphotransferase family protein [Paenibacillus silvae]
MPNKIKITLFHLSLSGSNNFHLYNNINRDLFEKFDIELLSSTQVRYKRDLDESDVYITTHGEYSSNYDKVQIDLWHGFPLKGMAKMDKQENTADSDIHAHWSKVDMIMSYSGLYNTAMNACNGANVAQYRITGAPRNDALLSSECKKNLKKIFPSITNEDKVIFFMPTFRKSVITPDKIEGCKDFRNLFGLTGYNLVQLRHFLEEHHLKLILKLHPFEEQYFQNELADIRSEQILTLNDQDLAHYNLDLYNVLGAGDMLITDYSSVYIDYLLLNRPIIFTPVDLEEYKENRGLLFEPYDFWTPGPKVYTQPDLQNAIERYIVDKDYYGEERNTLLNLFHFYKDDQSSNRIWTEIDRYIEENLEIIHSRRAHMREHKELQSKIKQTIQQMIENGYLAQANEAIQQYLVDNPADPDIFAMNGMLHLMNGDSAEAIQSFLRGHQHFPWDEDLLYNLGYVYESIGDIELAHSYYQQSLDQSRKPELNKIINEKLKTFNTLR